MFDATGSSGGVVLFNDHTVLDGYGYGTDGSDHPDDGNGTDDPSQLRHGVGEEWVTDAYVALHSEGCDSQDGGIGGSLGDNGSSETDRLAEQVRPFSPQRVELVWHAEGQEKQVTDSHAEEVIVGGRVHDAVLDDDDASGHVAQDASNEDEDIDHRHHYGYGQVVVSRLGLIHDVGDDRSGVAAVDFWDPSIVSLQGEARVKKD